MVSIMGNRYDRKTVSKIVEVAYIKKRGVGFVAPRTLRLSHCPNPLERAKESALLYIIILADTLKYHIGYDTQSHDINIALFCSRILFELARF